MVNTCGNLRPRISVGLDVGGNTKPVFQNDFLGGRSEVRLLGLGVHLLPHIPWELCPCSGRWMDSGG